MKNTLKRTSVYFHFLLIISITSCQESSNRNDNSKGASQPTNVLLVDEDLMGDDFAHLAIDTNAEMMNYRELIYASVYSQIFVRTDHMRIPLTATMCFRNVRMDSPVFVNSVDYYDSHGNLIRKYLNKTIKVSPLQSIWFVVEDKEDKGGIGANFVINWSANKQHPRPIVETIMTGASFQLGVSFSTETKRIKAWENGGEIEVD